MLLHVNFGLTIVIDCPITSHDKYLGWSKFEPIICTDHLAFVQVLVTKNIFTHESTYTFFSSPRVKLMVNITEKKKNYITQFTSYTEEYKKILVVGVKNVGSKQMADIRIALRGKAVLVMGKNVRKNFMKKKF